MARADRDDRDGAQLNAAAQALASGRTAADLELLVRQSREAAEYADHEAQQNPGEDALHRFREAARFSAQTERALVLAREQELSG
jgi:hypothetical protein